MKKIIFSIFLFLSCFIFADAQNIDDYNVLWTTQSRNSSESMPCGGRDIGLNIWVENGEILFYMSRSGTFDENNSMLKIGRMRLKLSNNPFNAADFKQELILTEGGVRISGSGTEVNLWVDVYRPVVHLEVKSKQKIEVTASYENWRTSDRIISGRDADPSSYRDTNFYKIPKEIVITSYKDTVGFNGNKVSFYHRNRNDVENIFDLTVRRQGMQAVQEQMYNPLKNRTFGGELRGKDMIAAGMGNGKYADTDFQSWNLKSSAPATVHQIELALNVAQTESVENWKAGLKKIWNEADASKLTALLKTREWWKQFWDRSYIFIDNEDKKLWQIGRNYQLFRYMLACNAYGEFPTKFNGGLFTFDPVYTNKDLRFSPDYRRWGGGTMTAQNQRLVYFPMLKSGDFDMLKSQFDFYLRAQRNAELRSELYWKHKGASFTEQIEQFGLPNISEWGWNRPPDFDPGVEYNAWLEHLWDTVLEFNLMMLENERYEGRNIHQYVSFIESCLTFFDEHYRYLARMRGIREFDEKGNYIIYPGSAAETYKQAYNASSTISALRVILTRLLELPPNYLSAEQRQKWEQMLKRIPPLPYRDIDGHKTIAPAVTWARINNSEAPQLYPVYPWGLFGVGKPDLDVALNTYNYDSQVVSKRSHIGWKQYNIFAARLGLAEDAANYTIAKMADGSHRFPAFWGPGFDWTPDHNWGGSGMIGLQEMLLQVDGRKIYLLPAWKKEWNARFKLHAPYQTIIEGTIKGGQMETLRVTPAERAKDVTILTAQ